MLGRSKRIRGTNNSNTLVRHQLVTYIRSKHTSYSYRDEESDDRKWVGKAGNCDDLRAKYGVSRLR